MPKVTSKLQVTVPKALAEKYRIRPGDRIEWEAAGDAIRVVPALRPAAALSVDARLRLFDAATRRHRRRQGREKRGAGRGDRRGRRVERYQRARPR
jgi:AbrB family looped-hinge helix DNA binding protein